MDLFSEKSSKYIGAVILSTVFSASNAFGGKYIISLSKFLSRVRLTINTEGESQKLHGDKWYEGYYNSPKEAYQANLKDCYGKKLNNTHLYILISSYKQAGIYGKKIVDSMEANAKHLSELGVTPHIIVRCDGDRENGGITDDIADYACALEGQKISFKCHESTSVKMKDLTFDGNDPMHAHWELVANESNRGCSGTRHASIAMIEEEVKELRKQGKYVYIGIFDGDDWVHEDFYPVLVLNALYTNAPVSNYNGRMGAHGLEHTGLRTKRMLGIGKEYAWTVYTDMRKDEVEETLSKEYEEMHPNACGSCCTTKIFEADYFYGKLNSLHEKKLLYYPNAKRNWIDLTELSCLDGFCKEACTCTTPIEGDPNDFFEKGSLFRYTQH